MIPSLMEYTKLVLGIALIITFTWFLRKSIKRYGFARALTSIDIILGLIAGLYLIITSVFYRR